MAKVTYDATGSRKSSVARVRLVPGEGKIVVNGRELSEYFGLKTLELVVRQPLDTTETLGKYDVLANVVGGGISGQAGAIRHGIARALLKVDADFRPLLKKAGLLTRDPREKERRKYGLKGFPVLQTVIFRSGSWKPQTRVLHILCNTLAFCISNESFPSAIDN